jgi:CysZ protein
MRQLFFAFNKAARDLFTPAVIWRALVPPVLSLILWVVIALSVWDSAIVLVEQFIPVLPWSGWEWLSQWAATFLLFGVFIAMSYVTTLAMVAIVILPGLINLVARRDYPDLARHGENVFWGSLVTTVSASLIYALGVLMTLPLLLIPGAVLVVPVVWTAWLNQRTFRYDSLAEHATKAEMATLLKRGGFFGAGFSCALLAHVPLFNFVVPVYTALVFVHLGLQRLRELRQRQGVQL